MNLDPTPLTDSQYHALTGAILAAIEASTDRWLQDDLVDIDTQRTGGLLGWQRARVATTTSTSPGSGATRATAANSSARFRPVPARKPESPCVSRQARRPRREAKPISV